MPHARRFRDFGTDPLSKGSSISNGPNTSISESSSSWFAVDCVLVAWGSGVLDGTLRLFWVRGGEGTRQRAARDPDSLNTDFMVIS